jgi:hypothetical protein
MKSRRRIATISEVKDYASCDQRIADWDVAVRDAERSDVRFGSMVLKKGS